MTDAELAFAIEQARKALAEGWHDQPDDFSRRMVRAVVALAAHQAPLRERRERGIADQDAERCSVPGCGAAAGAFEELWKIEFWGNDDVDHYCLCGMHAGIVQRIIDGLPVNGKARGGD